MPYVKVEIAKGIASAAQKRAVIKGMTDVLVKELGRNPEYIFVVIDEVDTDNWGRRGVPLSQLWQEAAGAKTSGSRAGATDKKPAARAQKSSLKQSGAKR